MRILVNGIQTHYRDEGQGQVLLFLHGWGSDLTTFDNLTTWAKDRFRVVRLDLPGSGQTPFTAANGWDLNDYSVFVRNFLDKLEITDLWAIIGHSMGGRIAIKAVGEKQLVTDRLVLLATPGVKKRTAKKTIYKLLAKAGKTFLAPLPKSIKRRWRDRLYRSAGAVDYTAADEKMKLTFKKLVAEDLRSVATLITIPTLLLYGQNDEVTPIAVGRSFQTGIKGSTLDVISAAGHFVHIDNYSAVVKSIGDFLR